MTKEQLLLLHERAALLKNECPELRMGQVYMNELHGIDATIKSSKKTSPLTSTHNIKGSNSIPKFVPHTK